MNYPAHYHRLVSRARGRILTGYTERHHILPKCMGGMDAPGNLVELTAEEHYVAHQLLVKMYPDNTKLVHAANYMAKRCSGNKSYGWLRRRHAIAVGNMQRDKKKPPFSLEHREKLASAQRGKKMSLEHREKTAAAGRGRTASQATRAKMSASSIGKPKSLIARERMSKAKTGTIRSQETRIKISNGLRRRICSPETREKLSKSKLGNKHNLGRLHSSEARSKMRTSWDKRRLVATSVASLPQ